MEVLIKYLEVFAISALPFFELRLGIPYGLFALKLSMPETFIIAILGNIFPVYFILKYLDPLMKFLFKASPFLHNHIQKHFEKIHHKHSKKFNELGALALILFVMTPLPGTGAWTGAVLAYLLNLPMLLSMGSIIAGIVGAAAIVTFFADSVVFLLGLF